MINQLLNYFLNYLLIGCLSIMLWALPQVAWAGVNPDELSHAVQAIEHLDQLRSGLASTLKGQTEEPTLQTMKEVCGPVGKQAAQLSQETGWQVKQIARKYRNPAHAPDTPEAELVLSAFEQNPELMGLWQRETIAGQPGTRYYRRIDVEASCLACHGSKASRPQFVKDRYPEDLAYDFQVGDLRGMYSVFMPDLQQGLQDSLSQPSTQPSTGG